MWGWHVRASESPVRARRPPGKRRSPVSGSSEEFCGSSHSIISQSPALWHQASGPRLTQRVWVTGFGALLHVIISSHRFRGCRAFATDSLRGFGCPRKMSARERERERDRERKGETARVRSDQDVCTCYKKKRLMNILTIYHFFISASVFF